MTSGPLQHEDGLSILLNPPLTQLTGGDSGHPAAIGLAVGFTAASQHIAWAALKDDAGPGVVHSALSSSHISILDVGAWAGDHWKGKRESMGWGSGCQSWGSPLLFSEIDIQGRTRDHSGLTFHSG